MGAPYKQIDVCHLCSTSILREMIITILLREHRGSERLCEPVQGHMALVSGRAGIWAQASLIPKSAVPPSHLTACLKREEGILELPNHFETNPEVIQNSANLMLRAS